MPEDPALSYEFVADVFRSNSDGWGIIIFDKLAEDKVIKPNTLPEHRLIIEKSVCTTPKKLWKLIKKYNHGYEMIIHFRFRTHGDINVENCHPYKVTDTIHFIHNGVIGTVPEYNKAMSDTWHFADLFLKDLISHHPDPHNFIRGAEFKRYLEHLGGASNRFAIVDPYGVIKFNESIWCETTKGVCVSNNYMFDVDNPAYRNYYSGRNYHSDEYMGADGYMGGGSYSSAMMMGDNIDIEGDEYYSSRSDNAGLPFYVGDRAFSLLARDKNGSIYGILSASKVKVAISDKEYGDFLDVYYGITQETYKETEIDRKANRIHEEAIERDEHLRKLIDTQLEEDDLLATKEEVETPSNVRATITLNGQPFSKSTQLPATSVADLFRKDPLIEQVKSVIDIDDLVELVRESGKTVQEVMKAMRLWNWSTTDKILEELISLYYYDVLSEEDEEDEEEFDNFEARTPTETHAKNLAKLDSVKEIAGQRAAAQK